MGIIKRNDILYSGTANSATKINFIDTIAQLGAGTVQTAIEKLKALIGTVPSGKTIEGQISELNENCTQLESKINSVIQLESLNCTMSNTGQGWLYTSTPESSRYATAGYKLIFACGSYSDAGFNQNPYTLRAIRPEGRIVLNAKDDSMVGKTLTFLIVWAKF